MSTDVPVTNTVHGADDSLGPEGTPGGGAGVDTDGAGGDRAVEPAPSARKFPLWTLLVVIAGIALVIGSGVLSPSKPTSAQRAAAIDAVIRCPSCEDLSVAASSAPTAIAVRTTVRQLVDQGRTDQQIKDYLAARYGSAIVLAPPTSGWSAVVWVLPVLGGIGAVAVLTAVLIRRQRGTADDVIPAGTDRAVLEERRRFLMASLADADAELAAGDLSGEDHAALRSRDLTRLAAVEQALAAPPSTDDQVTATLAEDAPVARRRFRIRRSRWFLVGAVASFAAAAVVLVPAFTSGRLPGQTPTGSVNLSASQQTTRTLEQAATLVNQDRLGEAASLYQSVLVTHPNDEVALAQLGWLEYRIGRQGGSSTLLTDARTKLLRATVLAPKDWAPYLYLGTIALLQDGDASTAVSEFDQFLANSPPGSVVAEAASTIRSAFRQADRPLPPGVPTT